MKPKSEKSIELYHIMTERGYPEEFCDVKIGRAHV